MYLRPSRAAGGAAESGAADWMEVDDIPASDILRIMPLDMYLRLFGFIEESNEKMSTEVLLVRNPRSLYNPK